MDGALIPVLGFLISLALLVKGADWVVSGALHIARLLRVNEFIISVTIVSFGTTLPEFLSSISAVLNNSPEMAFGTVIGSNIANITIILGIAAIIGKIVITWDVMEMDVPLLIASTITTVAVFVDYQLTLIEAAILVFMYLAFLVKTIFHEKRGIQQKHEGLDVKTFLLFALGFLFIHFGAKHIIPYALEMSKSFGISTAFIGLVLIAVGTSLPELMVSIEAGLRGKGNISIGNLIGANIFNALANLGVAGILSSLLSKTFVIEQGFMSKALGTMLGVTLLFLFVIFDKKITKFEGFLMLTLYVLLLINVF